MYYDDKKIGRLAMFAVPVYFLKEKLPEKILYKISFLNFI
jgi:hypothetical protein